MKQEVSVLKWASLLLEQEVKNLDSIQSVTFVKRLLYRIDPDQFYLWESGKGSENYAQVLSEIEKYFKNELQTDIKQHIDRLNVYKNPMEVWELLLGIAIKGNNRGENITLILDMDHNVQAELVGIVSNIIDKFGQNAAPSSIRQIEEPGQQLDPESNQQMFMNLVKENQELNQHIDELQAEIERLRQDKNTIIKQKKDVEKELTALKNQKTAFIQILASQNRTESRIFDDGDESVLHSPSLSELANDITAFVRSLKRRLGEEQQKVAILQESLSNARIQASRCAEQNQSYLLQLGNLNAYQYEIDKMREEMNRIFDQNSQLIDQNNLLQEERSRLILQLQMKAKEVEYGRSEDPSKKTDQFITVRQNQHRKPQGRAAVRDSLSSGDSRRQYQNNQIFVSEGSNGEKHQIKDELRQPKLRTKLQREIEYLKKSNQSLKKQNTTLKLSNESLQKSAHQFMLSNKEIVSRWEEDYQQLVSKMNEITLANQKPKENQQIENKQETRQDKHAAAVQIGVSPEQNVSEQQQIEQHYELQPTESISLEGQTSKDHKQSLWQEITLRLRNIIRKGKERQFALQNTIHSLRAENERLLGITREVEQLQQASATKSRKSSMDVPSINMKRSQQQEITINIVKEGEEVHSSEDRRRATMLSYLSIREGDDLEEEVIEKRRSEGLSGFYNMGSKIIEGFTEQKLQPSEIDSNNNDLYLNINRALFKSIQSNLDTLKGKQFQGTSHSKELEDQLKKQIKIIQEHYQQLNGNYQQIFRKLQLYSEQFNQAEIAKQEYHKILEQLRLVEEEVRADQQAEIVRLRIVNDQLQKGLSEAAVEKQLILDEVNSIIKRKEVIKETQDKNYQNNYRTILGGLEEIKLKYKDIMIEPQEFLSVRLEGGKEGEMQKFYKMYLKEKEKSKQLTREIELLSAVLLQYNTILHS